MNKKTRAIVWPVLAFVSLLAGCATPVPKSEITPKLYGSAGNSVALAVIEARPYVLSGRETPQYEGFVRGSFGIPNTVLRPNRPAGERFVDQFANMVNDGFAQAGVKVTIVQMPLGASLEDSIAKLSQTDARRYVVIRVAESNWEFGLASGGSSTWDYDFVMIVAGPAGLQEQRKRFAARDTSKSESGTNYNLFDGYSIRYRRVIESMFSDPAIRQALQN